MKQKQSIGATELVFRTLFSDFFPKLGEFATILKLNRYLIFNSKIAKCFSKNLIKIIMYIKYFFVSIVEAIMDGGSLILPQPNHII